MKSWTRIAAVAGVAGLSLVANPGLGQTENTSFARHIYVTQVARDSQPPGPEPSGTPAPSPSPPGLPAAPGGWPSALQVGVSDSPGGATEAGRRGFGFRYQYLAAGVNTGNGWANWNPNGAFTSSYISESAAAGVIPVFSYYMIRQSLPGAYMGETEGVTANLVNDGTMKAYFDDLELFFRRAGATASTKVVLHFEPDLWGFIHQHARNGDARQVPVAVASSGSSFARGRPNNAAGLAQTLVAMRDALAPNVVLAYHLSWWGAGEDPTYSNPSDARMRELAAESFRFYASLEARFDVVFMEFGDRDSAFKQYVYKDGGASWWDAEDFRRHREFIADIVQRTGLRVVLWQIPQGNTKMRAMDNSWNHYQDNRVEWLFDDPAFGHVREYIAAGVIGFLFGRGADGATCACDANHDGVTNPQPINGNSRVSVSADDDGGYFVERVGAYVGAGRLALP